jgi:hypothetical protein
LPVLWTSYASRTGAMWKILGNPVRSKSQRLVTNSCHECSYHAGAGEKNRYGAVLYLQILLPFRGSCNRELRRILIPRTSVNKGKKDGRGPRRPQDLINVDPGAERQGSIAHRPQRLFTLHMLEVQTTTQRSHHKEEPLLLIRESARRRKRPESLRPTWRA